MISLAHMSDIASGALHSLTIPYSYGYNKNFIFIDFEGLSQVKVTPFFRKHFTYVSLFLQNLQIFFTGYPSIPYTLNQVIKIWEKNISKTQGKNVSFSIFFSFVTFVLLSLFDFVRTYLFIETSIWHSTFTTFFSRFHSAQF